MNGVRCAAPANIAVTSTKSSPPGRSIGSKYIIWNCAREDRTAASSDVKNRSVRGCATQHTTLPACPEIQTVYAWVGIPLISLSKFVSAARNET